jgi:hypothetical protein
MEWLTTPPDSIVKSSQIGLDVCTLVRWAQTGQGDQEEIRDLLNSLFLRLCAGQKTFNDELPLDENVIDPTDEFGFVFLAAIARFNVKTGAVVDVHGLAALAGISYERLRHLAAQGQLQRSRRGRVTAGEARRFLEARNAPV